MEILCGVLAAYLLVGLFLAVGNYLRDKRDPVSSFLILTFLWPLIWWKLRKGLF